MGFRSRSRRIRSPIGFGFGPRRSFEVRIGGIIEANVDIDYSKNTLLSYYLVLIYSLYLYFLLLSTGLPSLLLIQRQLLYSTESR